MQEIYDAKDENQNRIIIEHKGMKDAYNNDKDKSKSNFTDTANINEDDIYGDNNIEKQ